MILVCGEALIDLFVRAQPGGDVVTEPVVGGSPYNVALGLARLGEKTGFLTGFSRDVFGSMLAKRLETDGVDLSFSPRFDKPTTLSIVSIDAAGVPSYRFISEGAADRALTAENLPKDLPAEVKAITFGSISLAQETSGSTYLAFAEREKGKRVISFDPNLRKSIHGDMDLWRKRQDRFCAAADIVKASIEDVETVYGAAANPEEVAKSWIAMGPRLVAITHGEKGAVAYHCSGLKVATPGRKVSVVDTVGAGDTFHAALLHHFSAAGRLDRDSLSRLTQDQIVVAINYAAAAAAVTCSRRGADMPRAADVEAELATAR